VSAQGSSDFSNVVKDLVYRTGSHTGRRRRTVQVHLIPVLDKSFDILDQFVSSSQTLDSRSFRKLSKSILDRLALFYDETDRCPYRSGMY
jgi:hypothetical protein